jgi:hypothetical protein
VREQQRREPGRAQPPVPNAVDLDKRAAPPLHGKAHPPAEMDEATPSFDDEVTRYHQPRDVGGSAFAFDPDAADAAADLAGDLGATFLSGATHGQDMSDVRMTHEDEEEDELPLVIEAESAPPRARLRLRPRRARRRA